MDTSMDMNNLKKQFLCCTPLNKFKWPDIFAKIDEESQRDLINSTVSSELVFKYPVKRSYQKLFLKLLISKLEQAGVEIADDVYNTYCATIATPDEASSMHFRHFVLDDDESNILTMKESSKIISHGTTGLCSWKAAFCLAEWCIENKQNITGKKIIELGSGVGLTGLSILKLCSPRTYYFSDCHPIVLKTLEENVRLNLCNKAETVLWRENSSDGKIQFDRIDDDCSGMKVGILDLKWQDIEDVEVEQLDIDLVIAADVLYDNSTFESLANALKQLMLKTCCYVILAATIRNEATVSEFLDILNKYDLAYSEETTSAPKIFIQSEDTPIRIMKIFRQCE